MDANKAGLIMIIAMELIRMMESHKNIIVDTSRDGRKDTAVNSKL
jgi:hypothetical protein